MVVPAREVLPAIVLTMIGQSRLEPRFELSRCAGGKRGNFRFRGAGQLEVKGDRMAGLRGLCGLWWASCVRGFNSHLGNLSILRANAVKIEEVVFPLELWTIAWRTRQITLQRELNLEPSPLDFPITYANSFPE